MRTAVIGASGNNAVAWTRAFQAVGFDVTQLVRDPRPQQGSAVRRVRLDLDDVATFAPALAGIEVLGLATPSVPGQVERELALIDAAVRAGVGRVVKLSVAGADLPAPISQFARWHAAVEAGLREASIASVVLRPNFFMQNLLRQRAPIAAGRYAD